MPVNKQIQLRRDATTNWNSVDPILTSGEVGLDTTVDELKIGDGSTRWSALPYYKDLSGYSQTSHNHSLNNLAEKSYNSLTDKPSIPSITGLLDETTHDALDHTGLTGIPAVYLLPTASTMVLGGVKVDGTTVTIIDGVISSSGSGMTNPMTTSGDIIIGGTSGAPTRLAKGDDGQVLTLASGNPVWVDRDIDWANPISVTTTTTLTIGKHHVCSGTTADYTVTLPAVSGNAGKLISVEMSGALTKLVTLDGNASEVIDGATTRVMWARETAILLCDGTQWTKVGGKSIPMSAALYPSVGVVTAAATYVTLAANTAKFTPSVSSMIDTSAYKIKPKRPSKGMVTAQIQSNNTSTTATRYELNVTGSTLDVMAYYGGTSIGRCSPNGVAVVNALGTEEYMLQLYYQSGTWTTSTYGVSSDMTYFQYTEIISW